MLKPGNNLQRSSQLVAAGIGPPGSLLPADGDFRDRGQRVLPPPSRGDRLFSDVARLGRNVSGPGPSRGRCLKLRYRGVAKNDVRLKRRAAALNLRNLIGRGLVRQDGAWVLAT